MEDTSRRERSLLVLRIHSMKNNRDFLSNDVQFLVGWRKWKRAERKFPNRIIANHTWLVLILSDHVLADHYYRQTYILCRFERFSFYRTSFRIKFVFLQIFLIKMKNEINIFSMDFGGQSFISTLTRHLTSLRLINYRLSNISMPDENSRQDLVETIFLSWKWNRRSTTNLFELSKSIERWMDIQRRFVINAFWHEHTCNIKRNNFNRIRNFFFYLPFHSIWLIWQYDHRMERIQLWSPTSWKPIEIPMNLNLNNWTYLCLSIVVELFSLNKIRRKSL